ncbi:MAG: hypothetical protein FVQ81_16970 [Candidatus Glassbacteria bacterium]|nr:hypothetical protein [Candidatus Glassbacteria bacterium]
MPCSRPLVPLKRTSRQHIPLTAALALFMLSLVLACGGREQAADSTARNRVTSLEIERRILLGEGISFGAAGAYEVLTGRVHYLLDPADSLNTGIVDAALAAGGDGLVRYSADFALLKPVNVSRGNGALLYHVVNRGNYDRRLLDPAPWSRVAGTESGANERLGRLMKQGWTVAFSGWQDDILTGDRLRLYAPLAVRNGVPVSGPVLAEIESGDSTAVAYLGADSHRAYPVAGGSGGEAVLRIHETYADPGTVIDREAWRFASVDSAGDERPDSVHILYPDKFLPNRLYTLSYTTQFSPVMGLCFPAVRELVTFLCSEDTLNPLLDNSGVCPVRYTLAYGSSQSGRFLRDFSYQGFNLSAAGGRVFDGVFSNVPGCRRGFFNYRHAQPSRAWGFYPDFVFPFTDLLQTDPVTGMTDGLLAEVPDSIQPKIFYIHHTGEYWSSGSGLTHASLDGAGDAELPDNVRIYTFAGTAHGYFELQDGRPHPSPLFRLPFNPNPTYLLEGPLLEALGRWVMFSERPPESVYPRVEKGELVAVEDYSFPSVPDVESPVLADLHPLFDWGPGWRDGVLKLALPEMGPLYPVLVPAAGDDGNALGGIKTPHVEVPVASYTGWNFPAATYAGAAATAVSRLSGAWLPFSATRAERNSRGDSRKSLDLLYKSRGDYLDRLRKASENLVERGLMFSEDIGLVQEQGGAMYDFVSRCGAWRPDSDWGTERK